MYGVVGVMGVVAGGKGREWGMMGRSSRKVKGPTRDHPQPIQEDVTQHILYNVNILPNSQHLLTMDGCVYPRHCVQRPA